MASATLNLNPTATSTWTGKTAAPMTTPETDSSSTSSSSSSSTISANDFLTLLVTEMKNQDPTADTDPNEYITQLVQVNSLEQLIDINSTLTSAVGTSTTSTDSTSSNDTKTSAITAQTSAVSANTSAASSEVTAAPSLTTGNLSVPAANASALGVAHALDGSKRTLSNKQ